MAVEARHLNLFPSQFLTNRETMMNPIESNVNMYPSELGYGVPLYNSLVNDSIFHHKIAAAAAAAAAPGVVKSESTLTYNNNMLPLPRKRPRDSINPILSFPSTFQQTHSTKSLGGHGVSLHMEQQQFDIDQLISQHMERIRVEIEEKKKWQTTKIMEAIEGGISKKLRAKEDEIEKIGKLNWALEEKVKSLCIENQIWRELAQTNEATANALRTNLEQVLSAAAQVKDERTRGVRLEEDEIITGDEVDDAQSCCGSSWEVEKRTLAEDAAVEGSGGYYACRNCGKEESCVLLLPCRHLCLCTVCGSTVHICPICKSIKNASVRVNMS